MFFFYGLKPLARNNPLRRTQASGHGTKEMVWNALARDEGGGGHGADALGTVAFYGVNGRFGRDGLFG